MTEQPAPQPGKQTDMVDHPSHYNNLPVDIECIDVIEHMNLCRGNAIKYIWRAGDKGDAIEDLQKAIWYLEREIRRIRRGRGEA